jgi:hypothetical protein
MPRAVARIFVWRAINFLALFASRIAGGSMLLISHSVYFRCYKRICGIALHRALRSALCLALSSLLRRGGRGAFKSALRGSITCAFSINYKRVALCGTSRHRDNQQRRRYNMRAFRVNGRHQGMFCAARASVNG